MDFVKVLKDRVGLLGRTVLEIGCGDGRHTLELLRATVAEVYALDGRLGNLHQARRKVKGFDGNVLFQLGDAERVPFPRADVIFHVGVLYHLTDPIDQLYKVSEAGKLALLLDTHTGGAHHLYSSHGKAWPCQEHVERPSEPREGLRALSRRLPLATIVRGAGDAVGPCGGA